MYCIETSGVGRKEGTAVESRAKAMPRNFLALANKHRARDAGDSSNDRLERKGLFAKGGTETEESTEVDPMTKTAVED